MPNFPFLWAYSSIYKIIAFSKKKLLLADFY